MNKLCNVDVAVLEQAVSGRLEAGSIKGLIDTLQTQLDTLLPAANREFANVVTEAYDLTRQTGQMDLEAALRNIAQFQSELDAILFPAVSADGAMLVTQMLPSPEMLFSDPDHVPRFVDWSRVEARSADSDMTLSLGTRAGISSQGDLNGLNGGSDRFDA